MTEHTIPGAAPGTALEKPVAVNTVTGEVVDLTLGTDYLARKRREVIDAKHELDTFAHVLDGEMIARLDRENMRSAIVDDGTDDRTRWELKTGAPTSESWPVEDLTAALDLLVETGKITKDAKNAVLVPQPAIPQPPKLAKRELNKLLKHVDPEVRSVLEAVKETTPNLRRSVTVTAIPIAIAQRAAA